MKGVFTSYDFMPYTTSRRDAWRLARTANKHGAQVAFARLTARGRFGTVRHTTSPVQPALAQHGPADQTVTKATDGARRAMRPDALSAG